MKVIVITGASGGIGAELARQLGAQGHQLALAARREKELKSVAEQCGGQALPVVCDVSLPEAEAAGKLTGGRAQVVQADPSMAAIPGAQLLVKVTPIDIFPNCPRYIPRMTLDAPSPYAPAAGVAPVEPKWKTFADFAPVVPPRRA